MKTWLVLPLLLSAATAVFAGPVVYNNGGPNQQDGNEMTEWIQAEDFTLAEDTLITDVPFWSVEGTYAGSIWYGFYSDTGGSGPNLGAPLVECFGSNVVHTATGNSLFFGDEYATSFDIVPFLALGGQTYWLGLHNGDPDTNTARAEFYWETTGSNGTQLGQEDDLVDGRGNSWFGNSAEHAFQLTAGAVPEPTTLAMLGAGLAGLALVCTRRA